jgi:primosomal protein N'
MYSEIYKNAVYKDNKTVFRGFTVTCPLCGREFGCNKTHHVYTALVGRKRKYYCSYSCYKQRPNPKEKR